ncbi:carboxypeptidase-like regulatory domain-containing protein [Aquimarina algiphila]|uniref:carboxypeptidase-like regulatory domain-containing protein n=1 Tax=Aquimarina algiphila TaxID=2047982 RepID=UPI0024902EA8|nr:carboxypeptidase-like regulatory domain-containing protein [Aquimarina algiphila]
MIFKKALFFVITIFCCCLQRINAQNQFDQDQFFCRILDEDSKTPIFYATVKLLGTNRGVIADDEGQFRLPSTLDVSGKISLSSIGYRTKEIVIGKLLSNQINIIYLKPNVEELDAVTLVSGRKKKRRFTARQIIKKALQNIVLNYPKKPFSYIAYYRDYQQPVDDSYRVLSNQKKSTQYINLNESIIEVFDAGFGTDYLTNKQNQTLLYSYHRNETFAQDSALAIPYDNVKEKYLESVIISPLGGNELNVLNITNAIRNHDRMSFSFIDVLDVDFLKNHFFSLQGIRYLDDTPIYEINFVAEDAASGALHFAKGKIFIAKENFAIHKLNYEVFKQKKKNALYRVALEYAPIKGKMYLNYITFNNKFQVNTDYYFRIENIFLDLDNMFFDVYFNRKLDKKTITPISNKFKITYTSKEHKVRIKDVLTFDDHLRIVIDQEQLFSIPDFNFKNFSEDIKLKIRNISDIDGNVINEIPKVTLNQYREIFVQEVFPGKKIKDTTKTMNKYAPLSTSEINLFKDKDKYWVNTPLKKHTGH